MKELPNEVVRFFHKQHYTIVSTVDRHGMPHSSCKGIVKIDRGGKIYLLDLYKIRTFANLQYNPGISLTAVDEHKFQGWCLKGKAKLVSQEKLTPEVIKAWEQRIAGRITHRLLKNIKEQKGHKRHPEAQFPKPEYMIVMDVEEIIDLIPRHVKG